MSIVYSIIIPHKNCLSLLNRCINSIPNRDDVEIIVVDDNSYEVEKPTNLGDRVIVVNLNREMSKGAGRARNIGMKYAQGRWLLFADADDYYTDYFSKFLDDYKNALFDVVYYNAHIVDMRQKYIRKQNIGYSEKIVQANNKQIIDEIKFLYTMPWNKMVSKELIKKYNIQFEEIIQGNDIFFSYQVGYYSKNIEIDIRYIYNYYFQDNTITNHNWNKEKCICYISNIYKTNKFKQFLGYNKWKVNPILKLIKLLIKNYSKSPSILFAFITNYNNIKDIQNCYVESICDNSSNTKTRLQE